MGNIAGLAAIASSLIDARTARQNTDKTNQANRELAEYSYSKDLEMWNKGNAYNDPTAQMARLKKAGLNPNLVYGTGAVGNTAGNLPKYNAPTMSYNYRPAVDPLQVIGAYQDFRLRQAETEKAEAEAKNAGSFFFNRAEGTRFAAGKTKFQGIQEAAKAGMMGNDYSINIGEAPTPWQRYQLDFMKNRNRAIEENVLSTITNRGKLEQGMKKTQLEIDNFLTNMWSKIIFGGAGTVAKFK